MISLQIGMLLDFRVPGHVYSCSMKNIATTFISVWHKKAKISPVKTEVKASGMQTIKNSQTYNRFE